MRSVYLSSLLWDYWLSPLYLRICSWKVVNINQRLLLKSFKFGSVYFFSTCYSFFAICLIFYSSGIVCHITGQEIRVRFFDVRSVWECGGSSPTLARRNLPVTAALLGRTSHCYCAGLNKVKRNVEAERAEFLLSQIPDPKNVQETIMHRYVLFRPISWTLWC